MTTDFPRAFRGSLLAAVMPVLHMSGEGAGGEIAESSGGYFFIWTLFALGVTGTFSLILTVRGLGSLRRRQPRRVTESRKE
jgi:hypothetical protein